LNYSSGNFFVKDKHPNLQSLTVPGPKPLQVQQVRVLSGVPHGRSPRLADFKPGI